MVPTEFTEPHVITYALGGLLQLAAAVWVFSLAPGDARHRSFAVLVSLNATWDVIEGLFFAASAPRDDYYLRLYTHLAVWTSAALVWFLSLYPTRVRRATWIGWACLGSAAALSVWFGLDRKAAETPLFSLLSIAWTPLLTLDAFRALRTPLRNARDPRAWSMILIAAAFLVYPLSQAVTMLSGMYWPYLWEILTGLGSATGITDAVVEVAYLAARIAALILAAFAIRLAAQQQSGAAKAWFVGVVLAFVLLARGLDVVGVDVPAVNAVVFGIVIMYALARARLFDIDLRLKLTVSRGAVVATFTFVFILVSQVVEMFFENEFGQDYVVAGVACGLLLFALTPLQRWAERTADRLLPTVEKTPSYEGQRKRDVYRDALAEAWSDGQITIKERRMLDAFAKQLALDRSEAAQLEVEVVHVLAMPSRTNVA